MERNGNVRKYDYRCRTRDCNRLLFRAHLPQGTRIDIRCSKCGTMHVINRPAMHTTAVLTVGST